MPIADWHLEEEMTKIDRQDINWQSVFENRQWNNLKDEGPLACKLFRLEVTDWRQKQLG
ncbi:MAG: hypothetical protein H0U60_08145 [Blastocatellia bacterium]|nr:hypothetical protein [Blastocatellia bacterium]